MNNAVMKSAFRSIGFGYVCPLWRCAWVVSKQKVLFQVLSSPVFTDRNDTIVLDCRNVSRWCRGVNHARSQLFLWPGMASLTTLIPTMLLGKPTCRFPSRSALAVLPVC